MVDQKLADKCLQRTIESPGRAVKALLLDHNLSSIVVETVFLSWVLNNDEIL